jgi:hypothetical protein
VGGKGTPQFGWDYDLNPGASLQLAGEDSSASDARAARMTPSRYRKFCTHFDSLLSG